MSKAVKQLICDELSQRFEGVDACLVVDPTPLGGTEANNLRRELRDADVTMMLVKNALTRRALAGQPLEPVGKLLEGSCALAWGGESIVDLAKLMVDKARQSGLVVKGAVMEGEVMDAEGAVALSKMPTRAELQSQIVGQILSPGGNLVAAATGPASTIASILKQRIDDLGGDEAEAA
jgi:large subunit ribosomal protein L10